MILPDSQTYLLPRSMPLLAVRPCPRAQDNRHSPSRPAVQNQGVGGATLPPAEDLSASPSFWGLAVSRVSAVSASFPVGALPGGSGPFEAPKTSLNFMADICNDPVSSIPRGSHRPSGGSRSPSLAKVCPRSFSLRVLLPPRTLPHPHAQHSLHLGLLATHRCAVSLSLSGQHRDGKNPVCPLLCPVPSTPKQGPDTCRTDERRVHHKMNFPPP